MAKILIADDEADIRSALKIYLKAEGYETVCAEDGKETKLLDTSAGESSLDQETFWLCVRGDSSRHSEGSGLGLEIARSLCSLMDGRLDIQIDGDLFKATVILKTA